jgi:hypothetical protein
MIMKEIEYTFQGKPALPYHCSKCGDVVYFTISDLEIAQGFIYCDNDGTVLDPITPDDFGASIGA